MAKNKQCRCLLCNRPIRDPKNMELKMGPTCAKRYFFENKGSLSDIYEKILNDTVADGKSSLAQMNMGMNEEEFTSMLHQVPFKNPEVFTQNVIKACKPSIDKVTAADPKLGGRTEIETLLEMPESVIKNNKDLDLSRKMITDLFDKMNVNFALFIQESLYSGDCTMMDAQAHGVREFVNSIPSTGLGSTSKVGQYKEIKIKEVYKGDDVTEAKAKIVVKALKTISTLIPDEYKKNVPPVTILVRGEGSEQASAASLNGDSVLVLNVRNNNVVQAAEAFHEYVHLVENFNKDIMKYTNSFLKKRRTNKEKITLKELGDKYNKQFKAAASGIEVYEDHFTDAYAGRTYGDLDGKKVIPTEVLTVGCEALMLDPVGFAIKDKEYFDFVVRFLRGKI